MRDCIEHDGKKSSEDGYFKLERERDEAERRVVELQAAMEAQHEQLCAEVQEARALAAKLREALEESLLDYDGYTTRFDGAWECSSCGVLAGFGETPERLGKAHREGCGGGGAIEAALAATPADAKRSLEKMRAEAGRDRAVRALQQIREWADNRAFTVERPMETAFLETLKECQRLQAEIEAEGWL